MRSPNYRRLWRWCPVRICRPSAFRRKPDACYFNNKMLPPPPSCAPPILFVWGSDVRCLFVGGGSSSDSLSVSLLQQVSATDTNMSVNIQDYRSSRYSEFRSVSWLGYLDAGFCWCSVIRLRAQQKNILQISQNILKLLTTVLMESRVSY